MKKDGGAKKSFFLSHTQYLVSYMKGWCKNSAYAKSVTRAQNELLPDYNEKNEGGPARHSRRAGMEVLPYAAQQAERLDTLRHRPQQSQTPVASADSATHNSGPEAPRLGAVSAEVPVRAYSKVDVAQQGSRVLCQHKGSTYLLT